MKAIVFDLDGTLIDSVPDLHGAATRMLAQEGLPPLDLNTISNFVGNGMPVLVQRIMGASGLGGDPAAHARLLKSFAALYYAVPTDLTTVYPGVVQALEALRAEGFALGICTNKPEAPTRRILEIFDLTRFFGTIIGGDTLPVHKPDPAPLQAAYAALAATQRLFVGDSEVDAATALATGDPFALYTPGYRKAGLDQIPHHFAFDHFDALPGIAATAFAPVAPD